jgi:colicin import membrane protein
VHDDRGEEPLPVKGLRFSRRHKIGAVIAGLLVLFAIIGNLGDGGSQGEAAFAVAKPTPTPSTENAAERAKRAEVAASIAAAQKAAEEEAARTEAERIAAQKAAEEQAKLEAEAKAQAEAQAKARARDSAPRAPAPAGGSVYYRNCSEVRAAGAAPIRPGEPGWQSKFDRDKDGVGCE